MLDLAKILSGLVTVTVSSLVAIKALRVAVKVNRDNNHVVVHGDSNTINIVKQYNDKVRENGGSYNLLGGVMLTLLLMAFPFYPALFSASLSTIAIICPMVAFIALIAALMQRGLDRVWDSWYVLGSVALSWVSLSVVQYIEFTAPKGAYIQPFQNLWAAMQYGGIFYAAKNGWLDAATISACICIGFSALYLSHIWLGLAFLKWRTFDGSLRHTVTFLIIGFVGAAMCSGWMLAHYFQNSVYASAVYQSVLDGPFGILKTP